MMHSQSQVALEINTPSSGTSLMYDGEYHFRSSASVAINSQKSGQKRTRQWAAWTRQEQENFFSALRQVGKNFEKITSRVQSKNKNQVRHYYYRLVRRMNKLLSPGFCLDAKNSKDTNAAMLRWGNDALLKYSWFSTRVSMAKKIFHLMWSLLEKYSCTPSKLYRKPRRFKIFIEALENQLLKDRNKAKRKRPCQGENYLETSSTASLVRRFSEDICAVKAVFSDPLNTPKLGTNKGALLKRNLTNADFSTGVLSPMKATAQKQRIGLVESAAYRRWEKAAMAGVALVADAAEQLERIASENCSFVQGSLALHNANCSFTGLCSHQAGAAVLQSREKLKLQLFPIDEDTRRLLEKDAHNPFLELTLSARKRISSVLEHLNRKWGLNTRGSTELLLLPYSIQQRDMEKCQKWSIKDADFTAADVHTAVGNPSVFRLRYGWFSGGKPVAGFSDSPPAPGFDNGLCAEEFVANDKGIIDCDSSKSNSTDICVSKQPEVSSSKDGPLPAAIASVEPRAQIDCLKPKGDLTESSGKSAFCIAELTKGSFGKQQDLADSATRNNCSELLAVEWADSLTNISVGDLLLEASEVPSPQQNTLCIQQNPISCDSFDAAVAAHSYRSQFTGLSAQAPIVSLWNAEETCDEFSFKKASALKAKVMNLCPNNSQGSPISACNMNSSGFMDCCPEDLGESSSSDDPSPDEPESALRQNDDPVKDVLLTDLYWPDSLGSLGQLDLDLPFPRYVTQDLCFTGSVCHSSFNLMIGNSLDAFQNGSFLGNDRKDIDCADGDATVIIDDRMVTKD